MGRYFGLTGWAIALAIGCGGTTETTVDGNTNGGGTVDASSGSGGGGARSDASSDRIADGPDAEAGSPPCDPPSDRAKSALCIALEPEVMAFLPGDVDFDGKGYVMYDLFTKISPSYSDVPVYHRTVPDAGDVDLAGGIPTARFDGLPSVIYARVQFADTTDAYAVDFGGPGVWLAGFDLSAGYDSYRPMLQRIDLTPGEGKAITLKLQALRQLDVTVSRAPGITPPGNGQGPLFVQANESSDVFSNQFGTGYLACADLSGSSTVVAPGTVLGPGPYWLSGILYDYGFVTYDGTLASYGSPTYVSKTELAFPANAYKVSGTVQLTNVSPYTGTVPDPETCAGSIDAGVPDAVADGGGD
jgi:hypothetical protein